MNEKFKEQYVVLESVLKDISDNLSERVDSLDIVSEEKEGKEIFPSGSVGLMIELLANAHICAQRVKDVKVSVMACNNALSALEELKENEDAGKD